MIGEQYTSFELSKKLAKNGCDIDGLWCWAKSAGPPWNSVKKGEWNLQWDGREENELNCTQCLNAYDLLWDICVKYAKEFFGDQGGVIGYIPCFHGELEPEDPITLKEYVSFEDKELYWFDPIYENKGYETISSNIFHLMQQGKKQEAEDLIWEHCKFNPKNK